MNSLVLVTMNFYMFVGGWSGVGKVLPVVDTLPWVSLISTLHPYPGADIYGHECFVK